MKTPSSAHIIWKALFSCCVGDIEINISVFKSHIVAEVVGKKVQLTPI